MLARLRRTTEENEGGFTLIELLVVMIIIGILAAIAIPAFLSQKKKGYEASEKSDLRSIATEISTQLVDNPTAVVVAAGTGSAVTVTADSNPASTLTLSPGNTLLQAKVTPSTGAYCAALANTGAGSNWKISSTGTTASQTIATYTGTTPCP